MFLLYYIILCYTFFFVIIIIIIYKQKKKKWNKINKIQVKRKVKTMYYSILLQQINFDSPRGGISLVTEKGVLTTSRLLIQNALQSDSGLYTCDPSNANPTSVRVHILNGKSFYLILLSSLKYSQKNIHNLYQQHKNDI